MDFNYTIIHKPGAYNMAADYLSRNPLEKNDLTGLDEETESYVAFISEHAIPKAFTREELISETNSDSILQKLKQIIQENLKFEDCDDITSLKTQFLKIRDEISFTDDGLVMRSNTNTTKIFATESYKNCTRRPSWHN